MYQQQGEYEKAVNEYEKILLAENPDDIGIHHNLSRYYLRLGRTEEAERERKIVQRLRKISDAIEAAQRKVRENPDDLHGYTELAKIYAENNQPEKAFEIYKTLLQKDLHVMKAYDGIATLYIRHNQNEKAIDVYETAVKVEPEYANGHLMLGLLYRQHGQPQKSTEHLQIARKLAQSLVEKTPTAENLDMLASVYYAMKEYVQAEEILQKAIELAPDNEEIQNHLNQVRQLKKRED
ncbi:tetratricopeptide repeat protein [Candidatus Poribacteria bacterium]|nr:tetratricopeptide repeat protein [Candidatus Poribacteria bacterium]